MIIQETPELAIQELMISGWKHASVLTGVMPAVERLYYKCHDLDELMTRPRVAIVGSRKVTPYGKAVTMQFAAELARQGIVIISGLALGVDAIAHRAALDAGGLTMAVLPSSLERIYPTSHSGLARRIVEQGGAVLTEYPAGSTIAYKNQFIERNRIVSGLADVLLVTEAAVDSGTMHTARFALEQGKDCMAIPGNITSPLSAGTNNLIRSGAIAATTPEDVLATLGLQAQATRTLRGDTAAEQLILDLMTAKIADGAELLVRSELATDEFNQALTMMEITGKIRALGSNQWAPI